MSSLDLYVTQKTVTVSILKDHCGREYLWSYHNHNKGQWTSVEFSTLTPVGLPRGIALPPLHFGLGLGPWSVLSSHLVHFLEPLLWLCPARGRLSEREPQPQSEDLHRAPLLLRGSQGRAWGTAEATPCWGPNRHHDLQRCEGEPFAQALCSRHHFELQLRMRRVIGENSREELCKGPGSPWSQNYWLEFEESSEWLGDKVLGEWRNGARVLFTSSLRPELSPPPLFFC